MNFQTLSIMCFDGEKIFEKLFGGEKGLVSASFSLVEMETISREH